MGSFGASLDRDANRATVTSNEAFKASSDWTFSASTTGAVSSHTVFTVTGDVLVQVVGICKSNLTSGGAATISMGTAADVENLIALTTAVDIDLGEVWQNATPTPDVGAALTAPGPVSSGADIVIDILSATITGGQLVFYCLWRPLSSDGNVVAATPA